MPEPTTGLLGWILAGVATIIATLSGVIQFLYRQQIKDLKDNEIRIMSESETHQTELKAKINVLETRIDECEKDRVELRVGLARHEERIAYLETLAKGE